MGTRAPDGAFFGINTQTKAPEFLRIHSSGLRSSVQPPSRSTKGGQGCRNLGQPRFNRTASGYEWIHMDGVERRLCGMGSPHGDDTEVGRERRQSGAEGTVALHGTGMREECLPIHGTAVTLPRPVSSQGPTGDSLATWPSVPGDGRVLPGVAHTYEGRLNGSASSHHPLGWRGGGSTKIFDLQLGPHSPRQGEPNG